MAVEKKFILTDDLKKNVFNAPEGYFESLQDRIAEQLSAAEPQQERAWVRVLRPQLAFAASFAALAAAGFGGVTLLNNLNAGKETTAPLSLDDFYASAIETYRLDEKSVLRVMDEGHADPSVNTEDIIDYLASSNVSLADIASLE
jgi:hypothetical protein